MSTKKPVVKAPSSEEDAPPPPMDDESEHSPPPPTDDEVAEHLSDDEDPRQFSTLDDEDSRPQKMDRLSTAKTPDRPSTTTRTPAKSVGKDEKKTVPTSSYTIPTTTTTTTTTTTGKTKIGAPQMVRVVMTDLNNAQFMTLKCESSFTVEEFSQILAKKLSLKGKGQVDTSHFGLCLNNPRQSRDPKRL